MATLQNLRNRGPLLVGFVGLALFAFILSDLFKSNGSNAEEKAVGTINDERFSAYEYEEIRGLFECVAAYNSHAKSSISELATIDAWETLRDMKTAQMQAEELGIKVTPQEIDMWLTKLTPYQLDLILKNNNREKEMYLSKYNPEELNSISRIPAEFCDIDPSNGNPTAAKRMLFFFGGYFHGTALLLLFKYIYSQALRKIHQLFFGKLLKKTKNICCFSNYFVI